MKQKKKGIPAAYQESDFDIPVDAHVSRFILLKNLQSKFLQKKKTKFKRLLYSLQNILMHLYKKK